jgi:hypothetical protein
VVEEWLSGWPISPKRTFPQVSGMLSCASRLPVKPLPAVQAQARVLRAAIFKAANLMIAITVAGADHD